ncbi:diguanylate cyclase domain-containing protein [Isachenkonia alkalipeptolytica]|uniref:diguanylate cyclase domain-containing protein n=1 Tax=Isachenkonia alkalipeptolytica TaxID=2565777 RepID=UPI0013690303
MKLTGLPNRRLFFEVLQRMILEHERDQNKFMLLFIDLDGFKEINDQYGHEAEDEVLVTVANRLSDDVRKSDTVARMGGDEFTIILRNTEDKQAVTDLIQKIHRNIQEVMHIKGNACYVNSSIGVTTYPENGTDSETLLRNADSAMYEVKRNGKGGYDFFQ